MKNILLISVLWLTALVAQAGTTKITYYVNDALGSPVVAMNEAGAVTWRKTYAPYGKASNKDGDNRVGYTGHVEDPNGLVYAGARYYDPALGIFASDDPVRFNENNPMSFGRYTYGNNNPYRYTDPDGKNADEVLNAVDGISMAAMGAGGVTLDPFLVGAGAIGKAGVLLTRVGLAAAKSETGAKVAEEMVTLYRGVSASHPGYLNALKGIAEPIGGHADRILHSLGDTKSIFTSWTTDVNVARGFAASGEAEAGVLLAKSVPKSSTVPVSENVQMMMNESEVLMQGTVRGANVTPVR